MLNQQFLIWYNSLENLHMHSLTLSEFSTIRRTRRKSEKSCSRFPYIQNNKRVYLKIESFPCVSNDSQSEKIYTGIHLGVMYFLIIFPKEPFMSLKSNLFKINLIDDNVFHLHKIRLYRKCYPCWPIETKVMFSNNSIKIATITAYCYCKASNFDWI